MTGRDCAIKIVTKSKMNENQVYLELMNNEFEILFKTDHPHIVRIFELLYDEHNFYVVAELMTGGEFYGRILKEKKFSEKDTALSIK